MNDFYVGYLPKAPVRVRRDMRRAVGALLAAAAAVALALVFAQQPFAASVFEFGVYRAYDGVLYETPYPALVTRDGEYLLGARGKHGASDLVSGLDGRRARLDAALVQRGRDRMLELVPGSLRPGAPAAQRRAAADLGAVRLRGEIVDSKCYLGVMNPGNGKVHRDCAVRCISGGLPAGFVVKDASGAQWMLLLAGAGGQRVNRDVLAFVGEPVEITGTLARVGSSLVLRAEPAAIRPVE